MIIEKRTILQILGSLMKSPRLIEDVDRYDIRPIDFELESHKLSYSAINNLFRQGAEVIDIFAIDTYLSQYPIKYKKYQDEKGLEFLERAFELSELENFNFWYARLKKYSAIKRLLEAGFCVSKYYLPQEGHHSAKQIQDAQENFDGTTVEEIFNGVLEDFSTIEDEYVNSRDLEGIKAHKGLRELKESLKEVPEIGLNLPGRFRNTISRGARLRKFYLTSGPTGGGKSRLSMGDACMLAFEEIYHTESKSWVHVGSDEKVLYITTEMEYDEIQTLLLAYLSDVNEDIILNGAYTGDEEERVDKAIEYAENNQNLFIDHLPDFNVAKIKARIRMHAIKHEIKYVFFDYIFTNPALMSEYRDLGLREDVILGMFSAALKDLCNELDIFIHSGTQLNGKWEDAKVKNQNLIRGSKAIVDKIDFGSIILPVSPEEADIVNRIAEELNLPEPNTGIHIYKARRSKYRPPITIWAYADLGTCRVRDLFVTDRYFNPVLIDVLNVELEYVDEKAYTKALREAKEDVKNVAHAEPVVMKFGESKAKPTLKLKTQPEYYTEIKF